MTQVFIVIIFLVVQAIVFALAYHYWRTTKNFEECWERLSNLENDFGLGTKQMQNCLDTITDILNKHGNAINKNTETTVAHQKAIDYLLNEE